MHINSEVVYISNPLDSSAVHPERYPLVEAMACGTPCIASDDPALVEVSGGAVLHFPRGDPGALRLLLQRVLHDPSLRDDLSRRGIERARAFRWERSAALHVEVYREAGR